MDVDKKKREQEKLICCILKCSKTAVYAVPYYDTYVLYCDEHGSIYSEFDDVKVIKENKSVK